MRAFVLLLLVALNGCSAEASGSASGAGGACGASTSTQGTAATSGSASTVSSGSGPADGGTDAGACLRCGEIDSWQDVKRACPYSADIFGGIVTCTCTNQCAQYCHIIDDGGAGHCGIFILHSPECAQCVGSANGCADLLTACADDHGAP